MDYLTITPPGESLDFPKIFPNWRIIYILEISQLPVILGEDRMFLPVHMRYQIELNPRHQYAEPDLLIRPDLLKT